MPCRRGDIALNLLGAAADFLNGEYNPDLVIFAGDLLNDPVRTDLLPAASLHLARLHAPLIALPGNHAPAPEIFYRTIPRPPEYLDVGGIRFIPFYCAPERPCYNTFRTPEETERMCRLAHEFQRISVSVQHVPLFRPGQGGSRYNYENADALLDAMRDANIRLTLSGHYHAGMKPVSDGFTTAIAAPALCEMPFRFVTFELEPDGTLRCFCRRTVAVSAE